MHREMKASESNLRNHVKYLTEIDPPRSYLNVDSLKMVADYIANELKNIGCRVEDQVYKADENDYVNIIGSMGPEDGPRVIVGAHYDSLAINQYQGADDNASGVAGLIETARLLYPFRDDLLVRIDFVAYTLEEPPFFCTDKMGSEVHAKSLVDNKIAVEFMICYEMIGFFSEERGTQGYPLGAEEFNIGDVANFYVVVGLERFSTLNLSLVNLISNISKIRVIEATFPSNHLHEDVTMLSDQINYIKRGIPSVMVNNTSMYRGPNFITERTHYHTIKDVYDIINFPYMAEVVNGVSYALKILTTDSNYRNSYFYP